MKVGDTAYIVESNRYVREVEIRRCSGGMFLVRFTDTGGGIQVKAHRLFVTREEAEKSIEKAPETKKVLGNPVYYGMIVYNRRTNSEEIKKNPKEIISVRGKHEARKISIPSMQREKCCLPFFPHWHRMRADPFQRTAHGESAEGLRQENTK